MLLWFIKIPQEQYSDFFMWSYKDDHFFRVGYGNSSVTLCHVVYLILVISDLLCWYVYI